MRNRASALRRNLGVGADGEDLLPRAAQAGRKGRYRLSPRVLTDVDLIEHRFHTATGLASGDALPLLRDGLAWFAGPAFRGGGDGYGWIGPEGVLTRITNVVIAYATLLMELAFDADDLALVLQAAAAAGRVIDDPVALMPMSEVQRQFAEASGDPDLTAAVVEAHRRLRAHADAYDPLAGRLTGRCVDVDAAYSTTPDVQSGGGDVVHGLRGELPVPKPLRRSRPSSGRRGRLHALCGVRALGRGWVARARTQAPKPGWVNSIRSRPIGRRTWCLSMRSARRVDSAEVATPRRRATSEETMTPAGGVFDVRRRPAGSRCTRWCHLPPSGDVQLLAQHGETVGDATAGGGRCRSRLWSPAASHAAAPISWTA